MVRLIVDDAGARRAFNVGEGLLTVGSGSEAKLKLSSPGVASLHVDIEIHGNKATLHPKPGVTAPHVLGRATNSSVVLQHGVPVKIGSATVTVEYEGLPSKLQAPAASAAAPAPQRLRRRADGDEDEHGRTRHPRNKGVPTWVWIAAGVPVIGLVLWFFAANFLGKGSQNIAAMSAQAYYNNAVDRVKNAQYQQALEQLDRIPATGEIDPQLAAKVAQLRADVEAKTAEANEYAANAMAGANYFETQLKAFVERYMSGEITSPEARVFMKRARYFRERWPKHPQLDWVARQESRFKAAVDLSKPPTAEDVAFEIESLTWASPRNYRDAFAAVRAFQNGASAEDLAKSAGMLQDLEKKRAEWFEDRKEQARWHYDRKETSKSIGVLLQVIRFAGDETMADWAANQLLSFGEGEMVEWLRGYRTNNPDGFEEISKNRVIAAYVKEHPL